MNYLQPSDIKHKPNNEKISVLHFIGAGRSGSTLLNLMLDNHPDIIGTGELSFFAHGWLKGDYCSCTQPLPTCSFWSRVQNEWLRRTDLPSMNIYLQLQQQFERNRRLPSVFFNSMIPSAAFQQYQIYTAQLYAVIRDLSGACIIADSSKNPIRALSLATIPEIDIRLVFLVRDVRGYVWSNQKVFNKNQEAGLGRTVMPIPVWRSTTRWGLTNLMSERVGKKANKCLLVRYEDMLDDMEQVFSDIGKLIDLDLSSIAASIVAGKTFYGRHVQAGNRLRMQKDIKLRREERWQDRMPVKEQSLSWMLVSWLMKRYGYKQAENV